MTRFRFRQQLIDDSLPGRCYAQTALADFDRDGIPELVTGQQFGTIFRYRRRADGSWTRHVLGEDSPSDVGACVLDVDGDGWPDLVTGGAWYRNSRHPERPFERIVFDPALEGVHDILVADLDGDGREEVITMSDRNDLRWYKIPESPEEKWPRAVIGPAVHAGAAVGDLNGSGSLDIVRSNVWFENVQGDASFWQVRPIGPTSYPPPDFQPYFAFDATRAVVCDMNRNGRNDIVFCDAEIPGGKLWWMENLDGRGQNWRRHEIPNGDASLRGAYYSLYVGDLDGDGDCDIFTCEMEHVAGDGRPRWYIQENLDGVGGAWQEHVILDAGPGGHEAVVGDVSDNGLPDIIAKPWVATPGNALGGKMFVLLLENPGPD